ncbi:MAG: DUF4192 domain-containing protein [Candidatus Nanopelagicales bacterium]
MTPPSGPPRFPFDPENDGFEAAYDDLEDDDVDLHDLGLYGSDLYDLELEHTELDDTELDDTELDDTGFHGIGRADTAPAEPVLVARGPESLPVVVPHLVGFVPEHSFVVLGHAAGSHAAAVTMRFDIPVAEFSDDELIQALHAWEYSFGALKQVGADAVTVVLYPAAAGDAWGDVIVDELPYRDLAELVEQLLVSLGYRVRELVCVVGDRVRSYLCDSLACCPVEGTALDPSEALRLSASLVGSGSAPLRNRGAIVEALRPRAADDPVRLAVAHARPGALARQPSDMVEQVESFLHAVAGWGRHRDERDSTRRFNRLVATAGLVVTDLAARDYLMRELAVECDRPVLDAARAVLVEAVRCADHDELAALAAVLGVTAWMAGDGAAARVALDRALEADPAYRLAHLVLQALDGGLAPWSWRESMRGLTAEAILAASRPGRERWPA